MINRMILEGIRSRMETSRLERLHFSIESEIRSISEYVNSLPDDAESDAFAQDECEQIEDLLGIAFVVAQTYLTSVRTALVRASSYLRKPLSFIGNGEGHSLYALENPIEPISGRPSIEVVNAIANYWKHHEEWQVQWPKLVDNLWESYWDNSKGSKGTKKAIEIAHAIGMRPSSSGNMRVAVSTLGVSKLYDLAPLRHILKNWADCLFEKVKPEF